MCAAGREPSITPPTFSAAVMRSKSWATTAAVGSLASTPRGSFSIVAADCLEIQPNGSARIVRDKTEIGVGSRFYARRDTVQLLLNRDDIVELATDHPAIEEDGAIASYKIVPPVGEFRWIHEQYLQADERTPRRERQRADRLEGDAESFSERVQRVRYDEALPEPRLLGDVEANALAPSASQERSVSAVLDTLELGVAAIASGNAGGANLALMETDARNVARRAQTSSDRNRADILLRRLDRLAGRPPRSAALADSVTPTDGLVSLAQFMSPILGAPPPSTCPVPGGPTYLSSPMAIQAPPPAPLYSPYAPPGPRHYLNLDALGFWVKHDSLPALVTTSPAGTPQDEAGVIGQPGTSVLFGNQSVNGGFRPGGRVLGGIWLDDQQTFALEGNYWALATASTNYSASSVFSGASPSGPILARPFFDSDPTVNAQSALLVAFPNADIAGLIANINGSVTVQRDQQHPIGRGRRTLGPRPIHVAGTLLCRWWLSVLSIERIAVDHQPLVVEPAAVSRPAEYHGLRLFLDHEQFQWRRCRAGGRLSLSQPILVRRRRATGDG